MAAMFAPNWILCLDEHTMSIWYSMFTFMGWVFYPRKPHPFSNKYHTVCCAKSEILTQIYMLEGKDHQKEMDPPENENKGKLMDFCFVCCSRTLLRGAALCNLSFYVMEGIVELRNQGILPIKKH